MAEVDSQRDDGPSIEPWQLTSPRANGATTEERWRDAMERHRSPSPSSAGGPTTRLTQPNPFGSSFDPEAPVPTSRSNQLWAPSSAPAQPEGVVVDGADGAEGVGEFNFLKRATQLTRMAAYGLQEELRPTTRDSGANLMQHVHNAVARMESRGIDFPSSSDPADTRPRFIFCKPGNEPRDDFTLRYYRPVTASQDPQSHTLEQWLEWTRKDWHIPSPPGITYDFQIIIAPMFGMVRLHRHPCLAMRIMHDMGDDTSTTLEVPEDMHLLACPNTNIDGSPVEDDMDFSDVAEPSTSRRSSPVDEIIETDDVTSQTHATDSLSSSAPDTAAPANPPQTPTVPTPADLPATPSVVAQPQPVRPLNSRNSRVRLRSDSELEVEDDLRATTRRRLTPTRPPTPYTVINTPVPSFLTTTHNELSRTLRMEISAPAGGRLSILGSVDATPAHLLVALVSFIQSKIHGHEFVDALEVVLEPSDLPLRNLLLRGSITVEIGPAMGPGPLRSLVQAATDYVFKDYRDLWVSGSEELLTLDLKKVPTPRRIEKCRLFGALVAFIIVHSGYLPPALSPAFLAAALHGSESIDDPQFIGRFSPGMENILLRYWLPQSPPRIPANDTSTDANVLRYILSEEMELEMEDLDMLAPEYNDQARSRFIRYRLLGGTPLGALFDDNPLVKAFVEGFSIPLNDGGRVTMSTVFGGAVKTLLPNLTPNVLTKGEDIVNDLIWQSSRHGDSTFGSLILTDNEQKFKSAFLHWIRGAGHVDHREIRERISSEEFERVKDCRHLRVRAFSCHVSGSEIRAENYMMNFTTPRTRDNFPISVHTCDRRVDISLTYDLIFMLNTIASDSSSSEAGRRHFLTIKHAYEQLGARVNRAIRSQVGDSAHVEAEYQAAQQFLQAVEEHRRSVPGPDYNVIVTSVRAMMEALAEAIEHSEDRHVPVVQVGLL
ncbi:hypothetical protein V5O48_002961 [Marasmius crinis-equi]|uniref:HECT domain-containing protein n=1 Tax=Marasmius crinis-equi TaxID=585013 RepID=A0ABR3FUX3_9AGAR